MGRVHLAHETALHLRLIVDGEILERLRHEIPRSGRGGGAMLIVALQAALDDGPGHRLATTV